VIDEMTRPRGSLRAQQIAKLGRLRISSEREGDLHTICLFGELDLAGAERVQHELEHVVATDAEAIVLDLSGLTFIDSTGVRLIVMADALSRADSDRLALLRGSPLPGAHKRLCSHKDSYRAFRRPTQRQLEHRARAIPSASSSRRSSPMLRVGRQGSRRRCG
jgi:anti-anti-sigma factor